jgi:predicted aspartyl protease
MRAAGSLFLLSALLAAFPLDEAGRASPPKPPAREKSRQLPTTVGAPMISPAAIDESLEVTGEAVAARQIKTRMSVGVMVNGKGPYRFLIDSGADRSVIGAALARAAGLPASGAVTLHDVAGSSRVETVRIDTLQVGSSEMFGIEAPALLESDLGAQGLVGIDALSEQRLSIDFVANTVTIQDPRRPERAIAGVDEVVITARRRKGQLILTEASIGKNSLSAVIDTGAQVTIGNSALYKRVFASRKPPVSIPVTLTSVTGRSVEAQMATIPTLRVCSLTLLNVPIAFIDVPPFRLFGLADEPALLLGSDVLETFRRVSLDFRNRKVRFVLR